MNNPRIVYFPAIADLSQFCAQVAWAVWYLAPLEPESVTIFSPHKISDCADLSAYTPEVSDQLSRNPETIIVEPDAPRQQDIESSDIVICWKGVSALQSAFGEAFVRKLRKSSTRIFDVDVDARMEGSKYIDPSHRLPANDALVAAQSHQSLVQLAADLSGYERSFLLCSGPEVQRYANFDLSDGIGIVCNSVINDVALMDAVRPKIQIFGDPIFHFGCSRYAHEFREKLRLSAEQYDLVCIIPIKYYNLFVSWMPELEARTLAVPFDVNRAINLDLLKDFSLHTTDNILTFLMLPVAASLSKEVYLLGCDGRPLQQNTYFWQHNRQTQFVDQMDNIKRVHPSFFNVDYDEYYLRHCDTVESYFEAGESLGRRFCALTPSFIPAIAQREHVLARAATGKDAVRAIVTPRPCSGGELVDLPEPRGETLTLEALSCSNAPQTEISLQLFNDGLTPTLARSGEFDHVSDCLSFLADELSLWNGPVEILQPCASVADVRALRSSRAHRFPSQSQIVFPDLSAEDQEFLRANASNFPDEAIRIRNDQLSEKIAALPAGAASAESVAPAPSMESSKSRTTGSDEVLKTGRERDWRRSFLDLKEKQADLEYEFELLKDSAISVARRLSRLQGELEEARRELAGPGSEAESLADSLASRFSALDAALNNPKHGWRNALGFQHFARHLASKEASRIAEEWSQRLEMELVPRMLSYLAHKICTIEGSCLGRLATDIKDAVIRTLCLMSLRDEELEYLEIGTLFGVNAVNVWEICRHQFRATRITCIDPLEGYYGKGVPDALTGITVCRSVLEQNFRKAMIPESSITLLQGLSEDPEILERAGKRLYNFILIDGDHSYDGVRRDFENYAPLVKPGGLLIIDDYGSPEWPEIKAYADEHVLNDERFSVVGAESRTLVLRKL